MWNWFLIGALRVFKRDKYRKLHMGTHGTDRKHVKLGRSWCETPHGRKSVLSGKRLVIDKTEKACYVKYSQMYICVWRL